MIAPKHFECFELVTRFSFHCNITFCGYLDLRYNDSFFLFSRVSRKLLFALSITSSIMSSRLFMSLTFSSIKTVICRAQIVDIFFLCVRRFLMFYSPPLIPGPSSISFIISLQSEKRSGDKTHTFLTLCFISLITHYIPIYIAATRFHYMFCLLF